MELTSKKILSPTLKTDIFFTLFGFLLAISPIVSGVLPFGCAFLCAVPKKHRRFSLFGVVAGAFFDVCIPLAVFCALYLYFVLSAKEKNGKIFLFTRLLLSISVSALRAAYEVVSGIHDMDGIFRLVASVVAYPLFTYAFSGYFDKKKELYPKRYDVSLLAFAFALSLLVSKITIRGVSISFLIGIIFTLCAARTRGFGFGGVCGVLCGLVSGGAATGALGVLGMTYGLLISEIEQIALLLSYLLGVSGYFYLSGSDGIEIAVLMLSVVYVGFIPLRKKLPIYKTAVASAEKRAHDRRISRYAAAFSSLSSLFYNISETTREVSVSELNRNIAEIVNNRCAHCSGCSLDNSEISNFFTSEIRRNGVAAYSKIPIHLSSICPNVCAMAREVNNLPILRGKESEKGLKQMADEYSAFSAILIDAAKKQEDGSSSDKRLATAIKNALFSIGILCDGVKVVGNRKREITVFGVTPEKIVATPNEIAKCVSELVGTAISPPEFVIHDDYFLMKMVSTPAFRVECAKISEAKTGETVCGDTVSVFENDENYFYCLVSDGMGSGRDAALTSKLSAIMLEKLLTVGAEKESALKLLNKALVEKGEEVFATVDLLEIDRVTSRATLIKAGAAPSILIRDGKATLLEARTPPAGIMKNVIADKKSFKLERGDMIVMLSDGILQTGSENTGLTDAIFPPMPSARALASKVFRDAQKNTENPDDMSVCVLRIC